MRADSRSLLTRAADGCVEAAYLCMCFYFRLCLAALVLPIIGFFWLLGWAASNVEVSGD